MAFGRRGAGCEAGGGGIKKEEEMTNLWQMVFSVHGIRLTEDAEREICDAVHADDAEYARQAAARDADCLPKMLARDNHVVQSAVSQCLSDDFGGMA